MSSSFPVSNRICALFSVSICCLTLMTAASSAQAIVALGDSNTSGYGVDPQEAFPARLESMLRKKGKSVRVVNAGVAGDTFGGMRDRIDSAVGPGTKLVIVQGGYNDRDNGVPPKQSASDLSAILSRLEKRRIKTVVCGLFSKDWDSVGRKLAATHNATFVPGSTCYDPNYRGPDGLHMSSQGHQVVASRLARVVEPVASNGRGKRER